jgi:hypothetical protein
MNKQVGASCETVDMFRKCVLRMLYGSLLTWLKFLSQSLQANSPLPRFMTRRFMP